MSLNSFASSSFKIAEIFEGLPSLETTPIVTPTIVARISSVPTTRQYPNWRFWLFSFLEPCEYPDSEESSDDAFNVNKVLILRMPFLFSVDEILEVVEGESFSSDLAISTSSLMDFWLEQEVAFIVVLPLCRTICFR